jgi:metal-sulfur cluster biosynthetic enzyme
VSVSQQAIENAVTRAVKRQHDLRAVAVQVALNPRDGARAKIIAEPRQATDLIALAKAIEATAKHQLTSSLGVDAKQVKVTLRPAP